MIFVLKISNETTAWYPGDLNRMFERIVNDPNTTNRYKITVLSRPFSETKDTTRQDEFEPVEQKSNGHDDTDTNDIDGPWVVVVDNFLNETEANRLIALGASAGYQRSTDVGSVLENGEFDEVVSLYRTSTNAWCNTDECYDDPIANEIYNRIEALTGLPYENYESFQLLQYTQGQFYGIHHDYIDEEADRSQGVRILTVFLYLNDVQEGGGTNFPKLNITVQPVLGRALIWPSVFSRQPHIMDSRTFHQALPVTGENEVKYGANVWIHQRALNDNC
jgi:prolyl 4-hydroxylase